MSQTDATLRLVVIGAGNHSRQNHLPALAKYVAEHPGEVTLAALCDLRRQHAEAIARQYGFSHTYADFTEMLRVERPDGCIAITPIPMTAEIASHVIQARIPLLMEKPPGATLGEAQQLVDLTNKAQARVMVSMNRRFDPALRIALAWWQDRPITYVRATIARVNRQEPDFMYGTAIHALDTLRAIAGDVHTYGAEIQDINGTLWYIIHLLFKNGGHGVLEVLPTSGSLVESYEIFGPGRRALIGTGDANTGRVQCWENGGLVMDDEPAQGTPNFVRNGTYAETCEFITALRENCAVTPSPDEVLQSVKLCQKIQHIADTKHSIFHITEQLIS